MNTDRLIRSITKHEGYVPTVYKDSLGIDTIGVGFALKDLSLSKRVCDMILMEKLTDLGKDIKKRWPWLKDLPDEAQEVVFEMCYQMGCGGVSKFRKFLTVLKRKNYGYAASEMLDSKWARSDSPKRGNAMANIIRGL